MLPALLLSWAPVWLDAALRQLLFGAWLVCVVVEGFAAAELLIDASRRLVRDNIDQLAVSDAQERVQYVFAAGIVALLAAAVYGSLSVVASGPAIWRNEWRAPSTSTVAMIDASLSLVMIAALCGALVLALALCATSRAPVSDAAALAAYVVAQQRLALAALRDAPRLCAHWHYALLRHWLLPSAVASWWWSTSLPSSSSTTTSLSVWPIIPPLLTALTVGLLITSRVVEPQRRASLLLLLALVVLGGELTLHCDADDADATEEFVVARAVLWRSVALGATPLLYAAWRTFGGGRDDDDNDNDDD